jgi:hypothetical protein
MIAGFEDVTCGTNGGAQVENKRLRIGRANVRKYLSYPPESLQCRTLLACATIAGVCKIYLGRLVCGLMTETQRAGRGTEARAVSHRHHSKVVGD